MQNYLYLCIFNLFMHNFCAFSSKNQVAQPQLRDKQSRRNNAKKTRIYYITPIYRYIIINIIKEKSNRSEETTGCAEQATLYFAKSAKNA